MNQNIKVYLKNNQKFLSFLSRCYNLFSSNDFKVGSKNYSNIGSVFLKRTNLKIIGKNNKVIIKDFARLIDCKLKITGDNNTIFIGEKVNFNKTDIIIIGNNNEFSVGNSTTTNSFVEFNIIDGTKLLVGNNCMFSRNINLWTGDYHSITNSEGERINPSENITIGNHVWIGTESNILKGVEIPSDSVIGAGSLITGKFDKENVIIAGNPASVVKKDINWLRKNI